MNTDDPDPFPDGWMEALLQKADLEESLRTIEDREHFHCYAMRGRIRTLQLRVDEAWDYLDRAETLSRSVPNSATNLMRVFTLHVYRFDNALLEDRDILEEDVSESPLPHFPAQVLDKFPGLREVMNLRKRVQGLHLLSTDRCAEAMEIFRELTEDRGSGNDVLAHSYLALACCHLNLGDRGAGERFVEAAELAVNASDTLLDSAYFSGLLYALHSARGSATKAAEWKAFLFSLACPRATRDALFARGEHLLKLARKRDRLLVF